MKAFLNRLHTRVGDLWWYSAMIFIACRTGDVINAFIGLWLVPKYVGPDELGAVLPLQQLTSFLTIPLGVIAIVFSKYVNTYAARDELGKVKSFIRDVLGISVILFFLCLVGAYLIMPFFYERLKIGAGLLTVLILASGFVTAITQLVNSTQQGLKRFKTMSVLNLVSAPIRLATMLVAMPIRALSGYMLGQTTPGIVTTTLSALDTHKALKDIAPDKTWRKDWKSILNYAWPIAINTGVSTICATVCYTVYRQRLPTVESSAFYLISRFAEIAGYIGASISVVMFPLVSEAHEKGNDPVKMVCKTSLALLGVVVLLSVMGHLLHQPLFTLSSAWAEYKDYSYLLPIITFYTGIGVVITNFTTYETACRRFGTVFWLLVTNIAWNAFLVTFTGAEFFRGVLPNAVVDWIVSVNAGRLNFLSYLSIPLLLIQLAGTLIIFYRNTKCHPHE